MMNDEYLFPNLMNSDILSKFPMSVVFTSEFCFLRRHAEELAYILNKHNKLLDYCCHAGVYHGWYFD